MKTRLLQAFVVLHLLAVPGAAQDLTVYFPVTTGHSWHYDVTKRSVIPIAGQARTTDKVGSVHDAIIGTGAPSTVAIQRTVNETNSTMGNVTVRSVLHVSATASSVSIVAVGVNGVAPQNLAAPQPLLRLEVPTSVIEGRLVDLVLHTRLVSQSPSTIKVPAGSFSDALLTEATGPLSGSLDGMPVQEGGTISIKSWHARNVGLAREERVLRFGVRTPDGAVVAMEETASKVLVRHTAP